MQIVTAELAGFSGAIVQYPKPIMQIWPRPMSATEALLAGYTWDKPAQADLDHAKAIDTAACSYDLVRYLADTAIYRRAQYQHSPQRYTSLYASARTEFMKRNAMRRATRQQGGV